MQRNIAGEPVATFISGCLCIDLICQYPLQRGEIHRRLQYFSEVKMKGSLITTARALPFCSRSMSTSGRELSFVTDGVVCANAVAACLQTCGDAVRVWLAVLWVPACADLIVLYQHCRKVSFLAQCSSGPSVRSAIEAKRPDARLRLVIPRNHCGATVACAVATLSHCQRCERSSWSTAVGDVLLTTCVLLAAVLRHMEVAGSTHTLFDRSGACRQDCIDR